MARALTSLKFFAESVETWHSASKILENSGSTYGVAYVATPCTSRLRVDTRVDLGKFTILDDESNFNSVWIPFSESCDTSIRIIDEIGH